MWVDLLDVFVDAPDVTVADDGTWMFDLVWIDGVYVSNDRSVAASA